MTWLSECAYKQREDDDLDWLQASSSGMVDVGPGHDHTLGSNGKFVLLFSCGIVYFLYQSVVKKIPNIVFKMKT